MGLFRRRSRIKGPYKEESTNLIYQQLFCDNIDLYKNSIKEKDGYPLNSLFIAKTGSADLQKIIDDPNTKTRTKILANKKLIAEGHKPLAKELLGVIVEAGLYHGLDVLASFKDGTARYINQSGNTITWETTDAHSNEVTNQLFSDSLRIIQQTDPWDHPRRQHPAKGNLRISFLVSDGLYLMEGSIFSMFRDPMADVVLMRVTNFIAYLVEMGLPKSRAFR